MMKTPKGKIARAMLLLGINIVVVCVTFFLIEGISSTARVVREIVRQKPIAERLFTQYDQEIGWINEPNVDIRDLYGKGKHVKTNSQRFRNRHDFTIKPDADKMRIICSGDSFTFGFGVDNEHTWCQRLSEIDARLETVNMGQGGYGIDQAYLWYKRNSATVEHDVHLFAFITEDFRRMERDNLLGYGKPILEVRNGALETKNTPVPKRGFYVPWLTYTLHGLGNLSSIQILRGLHERIVTGTNSPSDDEKNIHNTADIVLKVFEELRRINREKHSVLVLVYLPTESDYMRRSSGIWRQWISTHLDPERIIYIDLLEEFSLLSPEQIKQFFIPRGVLDYYGSAGHYTEEGNAYVAKILYHRLLLIPEIAEKFKTRSGTQGAIVNLNSRVPAPISYTKIPSLSQ